ncbi:DUF2752 domain-containing protein [Streptomyces sp. MAR4 CNX-425]|uniref:DUF2752 domain-containing protein n=1 Tax=Streptomyces sp. MAR4 CNX-425 TaxID=3406343 RepID=UPI003B50B135
MSDHTATAVPLRRLAAPLAALTCAAAAFAAVGAVDPNEPGRYPPCPVAAYTGLACPGCGGLRAAHALAHGDVTAALGANALVTAGAAVAAVALLWWVRVALRPAPPGPYPAPGPPPPGAAAHPPRRRPPVPLPAPGRALFALVAAFTLLRNLPFGAALAP